MELKRQNVGIDISKDSFVATLTALIQGQLIKHVATGKFTNNKKGIESFYKWVDKHKVRSLGLSYTLEATGIYYERLAYFLFEKQENVHVVLPIKAKKFAESLNVKSKTDKIDSKILGQMGVERTLSKWELSSMIYRQLRTLTRERMHLIKERTRIKNQLHAEGCSAEPMRTTVRRIKGHIRYLDKQINSVEKELETLVNTDEFITEKVKRIITIPGVSFNTAVSIIAETQGFAHITSMKQLTSYAGYDIRVKESGKWKGRPKISKKGNSYIRSVLFMPSLSSIKHSNTLGKFYNRLNERKQNGLISSTAVQRKLLCLIYVLWKNNTVYIEDYQQQKSSGRKTPTTQDRLQQSYLLKSSFG